MTFPAPTNGLNTQAKVVLNVSSVKLIMSQGTNTNEKLTQTVTATVEDLSGATKSGTVYWTSFDPSVATVSESGVITAVAPGTCVIEASTPAFGNTIALFNADGTPHNKVYAEIIVTVSEQYVVPDFWFLVQSLGGNQYQIQQFPETNVANFAGTVTYTLGPVSVPGGPPVLGTIPGTGTLNFNSSSPNFILTGTYLVDGVPQTYHQVWSNWGGGSFPVMSVRASQNGFSVSGGSSASSGQPYIPA